VRGGHSSGVSGGICSRFHPVFDERHQPGSADGSKRVGGHHDAVDLSQTLVSEAVCLEGRQQGLRTPEQHYSQHAARHECLQMLCLEYHCLCLLPLSFVDIDHLTVDIVGHDAACRNQQEGLVSTDLLTDQWQQQSARKVAHRQQNNLVGDKRIVDYVRQQGPEDVVHKLHSRLDAGNAERGDYQECSLHQIEI